MYKEVFYVMNKTTLLLKNRDFQEKARCIHKKTTASKEAEEWKDSVECGRGRRRKGRTYVRRGEHPIQLVLAGYLTDLQGNKSSARKSSSERMLADSASLRFDVQYSNKKITQTQFSIPEEIINMEIFYKRNQS